MEQFGSCEEILIDNSSVQPMNCEEELDIMDINNGISLSCIEVEISDGGANLIVNDTLLSPPIVEISDDDEGAAADDENNHSIKDNLQIHGDENCQKHEQND